MAHTNTRLTYLNSWQDYTTLLDIKDEVYSWWDHGLLSASLHPKFPQEPYMYIAVRACLPVCTCLVREMGKRADGCAFGYLHA